MTQQSKFNLLVNLPPTFFTQPELEPIFAHLGDIANLRQTSHNTQAEILGDLPWADAVIMWAWPNLDEAVLAQAPNLRFLGQINTSQATARAALAAGITLSEARHCWSPAVAEMALALILNGLRKVSAYHCAMRDGTEAWVNNFPRDIDPTERQLTGQPVGVIGFGGIGQRLADLLQPFQVSLRVYDPFIPDVVLTKYSAQRTELLDLVRESEVVVLCAANQPDARHLFGRAEIAALRPNAVLVNVGRSMLVDMPALQERLSRGDLIALLDVFDQEPLEADSPLRTLPNTYLTPHRAGGLLVSIERGLEMLTADLEAFREGRPLRWPVTPEMLISFSG
jgi:D-3-phosphoglycerate dehydrogenase / 2-oxoglutarate reductase